MKKLFFLLLTIFMLLVTQTYAESFSLIITGSGGTDEYEQKFLEWGQRLQNALLSVCEHPRDNIYWLSAINLDPAQKASLANIKSTLNSIQKNLTLDDVLYIYLIGHGSYLGERSAFHIEGKDLTAKQLNEWLDCFNDNRLVIINTTPASSGYINILSAPKRVVATATRTTEQKQATEFAGMFIKALEEGLADQNVDGRISVLEILSQSARLTSDWYKQNGYIATENALIDDNGDKRGTRLEEININELKGSGMEQDGIFAKTIFLKEFSFPDNAPQILIDTYLALLDRVESLKESKPNMEKTEYDSRLESLLMDVAHTHQFIKRFENKTINLQPPINQNALMQIDFSKN